MEATGEIFELTYKGEAVKIEGYRSKQLYFYKAHLASPLFLTQLRKVGAKIDWTSVPEGRQKEAEEIGKLIEEVGRKPEKPKDTPLEQKTLF